MKLFVVGHGRHGKDTAASCLAGLLSLRACDSSWFACENVVWPTMKHVYATPEECYADRRNNRENWYEQMSEYNRQDAARLAREIFQEYDIYVGIRSRREFLAAKELADLSIWIDAFDREPPESPESMSILREDADIIVDNNGTPHELSRKLSRLCSLLR